MLNYDPMKYAYPSHRNVVYACHAMAAAMPLLEPTSNGSGSDCFALVWIEKDKRLYGLNASGVAPMALTLDVFCEKGLAAVPHAEATTASRAGRSPTIRSSPAF